MFISRSRFRNITNCTVGKKNRWSRTPVQITHLGIIAKEQIKFRNCFSKSTIIAETAKRRNFVCPIVALRLRTTRDGNNTVRFDNVGCPRQPVPTSNAFPIERFLYIDFINLGHEHCATATPFSHVQIVMTIAKPIDMFHGSGTIAEHSMSKSRGDE